MSPSWLLRLTVRQHFYILNTSWMQVKVNGIMEVILLPITLQYKRFGCFFTSVNNSSSNLIYASIVSKFLGRVWLIISLSFGISAVNTFSCHACLDESKLAIISVSNMKRSVLGWLSRSSRQWGVLRWGMLMAWRRMYVSQISVFRISVLFYDCQINLYQCKRAIILSSSHLMLVLQF